MQRTKSNATGWQSGKQKRPSGAAEMTSTRSASEMGAPGVHFFFNKALAAKHLDDLRKHHLEVRKASPKNVAAMKCPSCSSKGSCGNCIKLNDGRDPCLNLNKFRFLYLVYNYANWPAAPQVPIVGVSQILTTIDDNNASVENYTGLLPTIPAGQVQVVFPNGIGLGPSVPSKAIIGFNGIRAANGAGAATANLLNGLWRVKYTGTPETWTLQRLELTGYQIGMWLQAKIYRDNTTLPADEPITETLEVTELNLPERVFTLELTDYGETPLFIALSVCGATEPRCCASDKPCHKEPCCAHQLQFSLVADPKLVQSHYAKLSHADKMTRLSAKRAMLREAINLPAGQLPSFKTWLADRAAASAVIASPKQQQPFPQLSRAAVASSSISAATNASKPVKLPVPAADSARPTYDRRAELISKRDRVVQVASTIKVTRPNNTSLEQIAAARSAAREAAKLRAQQQAAASSSATVVDKPAKGAVQGATPSTPNSAATRRAFTPRASSSSTPTPKPSSSSSSSSNSSIGSNAAASAQLKAMQRRQKLRAVMDKGPIADPDSDSDITPTNLISRWTRDVKALADGILTGDAFSATWTAANLEHVTARLEIS